jgi:protein gp37
MGEQTAISWADSTANLWIGCQKVSPACDHCYAEDLMSTGGSRFKRVEWGPHGQRQLCKSGWADIRRWQRRAAANVLGVDPDLGRRRRIFVNSLSDFFDNHESVVWRDDAWALIRDCPNLIFMLVTKRPQLIGRMLPDFWPEIAGRVWLLTTVENQEEADRRVPALLSVTKTHDPPAVFGLSCEPLLGEIDLEIAWHGESCIGEIECWGDCGWCSAGFPPLHNCRSDRQSEAVRERGSSGIDWVIVGGESGDEARPMHPWWVERLKDQCASHGVPFHFKQWGEWSPDRPAGYCAVSSKRYSHEMKSIFADGRPYRSDQPDGWLREDCVSMYRGGKNKTGRLLDGQEHLAFPDA